MIGKYDLEDEVLISKLEFAEVSEEEGKEKREMYDNRRECKVEWYGLQNQAQCGVRSAPLHLPFPFHYNARLSRFTKI